MNYDFLSSGHFEIRVGDTLTLENRVFPCPPFEGSTMIRSANFPELSRVVTRRAELEGGASGVLDSYTFTERGEYTAELRGDVNRVVWIRVKS